MNTHHGAAGALLALLISGCSLFSELSEPEQAAASALEGAQILEDQGHIDEAVRAYGEVAETYPASPTAVTAIRKAALLSASAANPARNDSVARAWLRIYLSKDITQGERETASLLLDRIAFSGELLQRLQHQEQRGDSLSALLREQSTLMRDQGQALEALRKELYRTAEELRKLKDIDERTSRRRPGTGSP
jgi:hypothetical protein